MLVHTYARIMVVALFLIYVYVSYNLISIYLRLYTQIFQHVAGSGSFWLGLIVCVTIITGRDVYFAALERYFNPKPYHILSEV